MSIYGTIETCEAQAPQTAAFREAFAFLRGVLDGTHPAARTLGGLEQGKIERVDLVGEGGREAYALLQYPTTRARADQKAESHREYADVQAVVDGDEILEVMPLDGLTVTQAYDAERDVALYEMPGEGSRLILRRGLAAVLFPEDGHAPLQDPKGVPTPSRRIVVKVRVA